MPEKGYAFVYHDFGNHLTVVQLLRLLQKHSLELYISVDAEKNTPTLHFSKVDTNKGLEENDRIKSVVDVPVNLWKCLGNEEAYVAFKVAEAVDILSDA